jgi:hypothetical protein
MQHPKHPCKRLLTYPVQIFKAAVSSHGGVFGTLVEISPGEPTEVIDLDDSLEEFEAFWAAVMTFVSAFAGDLWGTSHQRQF